jgi:RNA recognition motif-containing protein
MSAQ